MELDFVEQLWLPACLLYFLTGSHDECDVGPPEWFSRLNTYVCVPTSNAWICFWFKNYQKCHCAACSVLQLQLGASTLLHRDPVYLFSLSACTWTVCHLRFVSLQTALAECSSPFAERVKVPCQVSPAVGYRYALCFPRCWQVPFSLGVLSVF